MAVSFILFEAIVISVIGFNLDAITIIIGPGLLIVCGLCMFFFIRHTKQAIENRKATGKALIVTSSCLPTDAISLYTCCIMCSRHKTMPTANPMHSM